MTPTGQATSGTSPSDGVVLSEVESAPMPVGEGAGRACTTEKAGKLPPIDDYHLRPPDCLRTLDEVYNPCEVSHLLVGNGLNLQLGYKTSSLEILKAMAIKYPEYYGEYYRNIPRNFEFEKIFVADLSVSRELIIQHFTEALVEIVGRAQQRIETAVSFLFRFDSMVSLNFDLVIPLTYSMIDEYSIDLLWADTYDALRGKFGLRELFKTGFGLPRYRILGKDSKPPKGRIRKGGLRAIKEEGLIKYDYWYGRLRPAEGFRQCGNRLVWDEKSERNCHYPHGGLFIHVDDGAICKLDLTPSTDPEEMLHQLELEEYKPLLVLDSDSVKKMKAISDNDYLDNCVKALGEMEGALYVYGLGIDKSTDIHLWNQIDGNKKLHSIYVAQAVGEQNSMERIKKLLPSKDNIIFFDQEL